MRHAATISPVTDVAVGKEPAPGPLATANGSALAGSDYAALAHSDADVHAGRDDQGRHRRSDQRHDQRARRILRPEAVLAGRRDAAGHQRAGLHRSQRRGERRAAAHQRLGRERRRVQHLLEFVVSLSAPSTQAVSVTYNNSNITAANGSDYFALASTLTFAPGETTKVVKIPVLDTAGVEPTEVMTLNLFSAVNATIARPFAIGTIFDNDQASGTPKISVSDGIVDESEPRATFTVTLDKPSTSQVTVNYATANGNATGRQRLQRPGRRRPWSSRRAR